MINKGAEQYVLPLLTLISSVISYIRTGLHPKTFHSTDCSYGGYMLGWSDFKIEIEKEILYA